MPIEAGLTASLFIYMPIIYLKHPIHGNKIASMELEAKYDETHGWVRYNPEAIEEEAPVENTLARKRKRVSAEQPAATD